MKTNYSIVMVDDNADDHFFFKESLKRVYLNCSLTSVYNGAELFDLLLKKKSRDITLALPDVIILDLNMPVLNGLETLEKLKKSSYLKFIPAYILTTSRSLKESTKALHSGAKGFYIKPNSYDKLQEIISEILITL